MSLSSLFKNTSVQEEAINELSLLVSSTTRWSTYWGDFRDSVWGRGLKSFQKEEPVERDDVDPVDHVELPTTHPVVTLPATLPNVWKLHSRQILVRSEYNEAERTAVLSSESDKDVFVVTGQPGIGLLPLLSAACRIQYLIREVRLFTVASHAPPRAQASHGVAY